MEPAIKIEITTGSGPTVELIAVGDFHVPLALKDQAFPSSLERLYAPEVLALCGAKDLSLVDLESAVTPGGAPILKSGPHLMGHPRSVEAMRLAAFDVASLANNHILDYGPEAMFATVDACERADLRTVGVGRNQEEASQPLYMEANGLRLAIIALTEEEFCCAGETMPGAARMDMPNAARIIRLARENADIVVISAHGGKEYFPAPSPRVQNWYRFMVDCGAHAVLGHHPHTIQGMEVYRGAPICYSLGNFLFVMQSRMPACWYQGMVTRVRFGQGRAYGVEVFPVQLVCGRDGARLGSLQGAEMESFIARLHHLNQIASDPIRVREMWSCFCQEMKASCLTMLKGSSGLVRAQLDVFAKQSLKGLSLYYGSMLLSEVLARFTATRATHRRGLTTLLNLVRCPAHRELLTTVLEMEREGFKPSREARLEYDCLMEACR